MDRGEIIEQGTPQQLFDNPKTERLMTFIGVGR
jgi:ABC-type histidine transport system ATPase subunit